MEALCDEEETVKGFCYLGDRLNASGGCEIAVTSRVRIGWMKFRECGELLSGRRFSLIMKGMVYRSYVRSAMLYGSGTWCLRETEMAILRSQRAMVRSMCGVKLTDRKKNGGSDATFPLIFCRLCAQNLWRVRAFLELTHVCATTHE